MCVLWICYLIAANQMLSNLCAFLLDIDHSLNTNLCSTSYVILLLQKPPHPPSHSSLSFVYSRVWKVWTWLQPPTIPFIFYWAICLRYRCFGCCQWETTQLVLFLTAAYVWTTSESNWLQGYVLISSIVTLFPKELDPRESHIKCFNDPYIEGSQVTVWATLSCHSGRSYAAMWS